MERNFHANKIMEFHIKELFKWAKIKKNNPIKFKNEFKKVITKYENELKKAKIKDKKKWEDHLKWYNKMPSFK